MILRSASLACMAIVALGCGRSEAPAPARAPADASRQANALFVAGQYEQAAAALEQFVRTWPAELEARERWAYALAALGQFDQVDLVLRTAPADQQAGLMPLRRAFNIYRYYHTGGAGPEGVFRVASIRDALEAIDLGELPIAENPGLPPMKWEELLGLFQLWVRWNQVTRNGDLAARWEWMPVLMVAEPQRLAEQIDKLRAIEQQSGGDVWLHPDDHGNWLAHVGVLGTRERLVSPSRRVNPGSNEFTETAEPTGSFTDGVRNLTEWLRTNVPDAAVAAVAAIRPEPNQPFDQRLALRGKLADNRLRVETIRVAGPAQALCDGYAEYRRLLAARQVTAQSTDELGALARAYAAAGLPPTAFHVDEGHRIFAENPGDLACLLSLVRYGAALFASLPTTGAANEP
jgi:tetratricopeptide (TPR) repeat protein